MTTRYTLMKKNLFFALLVDTGAACVDDFSSVADGGKKGVGGEAPQQQQLAEQQPP